MPVIFLTARRRELDEVVGLEMGADDYITKPFDVDVLLAHIKAVLRRYADGWHAEKSSPPVAAGDLDIDPGAHTAAIPAASSSCRRASSTCCTPWLPRPEKSSPRRALTRVWGAEFIGQPQVVYVHIRWLRQKIEDDPNHPRRLQTVRGVGYRLASQPEE